VLYRVSMIAPWFADTPLLGPAAAMLKGVPLATVDDAVSAMIGAATTTESGKTFVVDERCVCFPFPPFDGN
jgi:hypothetical protein